MTLKGTVWTPIGPSPIARPGREDNGLVTAIAVNPNNANIIYIGTAGGGIWRSFDGGVTWKPIFDQQLSLGIGEPGALAIDPSNTDTLYAGTSGRLIFRTFSPNTGTFALVQAGLFKSTDGGSSWIRLGSGFPAGNAGNARDFAGRAINVIIVDPANRNIVYLACNTGVWRSVDGGQNWTLGVNANGDALSLVLDTSSPAASRVLYAGITGRGVIQSTDGGQNWTQILTGATLVVATALCPTPPCPPRGLGRVSVALAPPISPPNSAGVQVLYATMEGTGTGAPNPVGLFMSTDQGVTWNQRPATGMPTVTYQGYCLHIAVDPASPGDGSNDTIYFGTRDQGVSIDSGATFTGLAGLHADTHAWGFLPQPGSSFSIVLCGTDGGLSKSSNRGGNWTMLNSGGLQCCLLYNIDIKPDATASVTIGALQDNGLETTSGGTGLDWQAAGGDGFDIAYDATNASQVYGCSNAGTAPLTRISESTDDGVSFPTDITPWGTTTDQGIYLAPVATDPSNGGIVYALGNQNLWQSRDGGGTWRFILSGLTVSGNDVNVAVANGNNVVVAVGTQVFVSTNALAPTVGSPSGVTFTNITWDLPTNRNVARAAFDPTDPTVIYAVLGGLNPLSGRKGHIFRFTVGATSWTDISPIAPDGTDLDIPFSAIALDGSDTPTTIYAGTEFGVLRSVNGGASWSVIDDIHFPKVPVLDLALRNGILRAGTYGRGVFEFAKPTGPVIAVDLEHGLAFGTVCEGPQYLTLEIFNVGAQDLVINSVQRLMGSTSFSVLSTPSTPLVIAPGAHIEFTIVYNPTGAAGVAEIATIRIISNDPTAPTVDLLATGTPGSATLVTAIADNGNIGSVCLGSFVEEKLTINNSGSCPLLIENITSNSAEFMAPDVTLNYPLVISPGGSVEVVIRFQPTSFGAKAAVITLVSNDPTGPRELRVSGVALEPQLKLLIADVGNFGNVCIGSFADKPLTLINSGQCRLTITNIASSSPSDFQVPQVSPAYPVTIAAGGSLKVPIRFQPDSFGPKSATITITSDDPASPHTIDVSGNVPSGKLAVTGTTCFGGVKACSPTERTLSICNVGDCNLHVTSVAFKRKNRHWKLINNPFPATLHPGSCLGVLIRYKADERCPRCMELVITSDDPSTPVKILDVMAYTIWSDCGCKQCCEDCRKGCCDKHHKESCCETCPDDCCCDDDDEEEEHEEVEEKDKKYSS